MGTYAPGSPGAGTGANTFTGAQTAPDFIASGLTGATAASRYVGATASGAPASGTFAVGDLVIDQSGKLWVCTAAGTPGTWAQIGGSAGAVTQIARKTQADSQSGFIKFTSIPQTYNILWLVWSTRSTISGNTDNTVIRANNDSSANYIDEAVIGTTTTASAAQHTGSGGLVIADAVPGNTGTANFFGAGELLIPDYTSTGKFKPALFRGYDPQGQVATMAGGQFKTTSAITELDIFNNLDWASPSSWTLYGLT